MNGFGAFFSKEWLEIRRTWRIWVIPGMLLFFGLTSPILALVTPSLMSSVAESQPGMTVTLPPATAKDADAQFIKNLSQLMIFALIIAGAGSVSGERSSGTAILAVTKPMSRSALVGAKLSADLILLAAATVLATVLCGFVTMALFAAVSWERLSSAVGLWLTLAVLLTCAMSFFSAALRSRGAAAGAGLGFYFAMLLTSLWPAAEKYSMVGLPAQIMAALNDGAVAWAWPVGTGLFVAGLLAILAMQVFEKQEL